MTYSFPCRICLLSTLALADDPVAGTNTSRGNLLQPLPILRIEVVCTKSVKHGSSAVHPIRKVFLFSRVQLRKLAVDGRIPIELPTTFFESDGSSKHPVTCVHVTLRREPTL